MDINDMKLLQQRVTLLRAEGKYKEAIEESQELLKHGLAMVDHKSVLIAYLVQAASYYCIGAIEEAFQSIDAYSEVCQQYGDDVDWLSYYNVRFLLYEVSKDYKKAKETLHRTIELGRKTEKYNIVSNGYSNLSHIFIIGGNYEKALQMAQLGLEMANLHEPDSEILKTRVKLNMAKSYIGLHRLNESKRMMDEILETQILDSFIREKSQFYDLLGTWYAKQDLYKEAFDAYSTSKQLVESYNDIYLLKTIQEERMKLCELLNDIETGYIVQKEYIQLLTEISKQELELTALKLEVKHNLVEIEKKAGTDFLTGAYNRNYLETVAKDLLKQASTNRENIVCILFDIDDFKYYNDHHGHLFGDEVIKQVSTVCKNTLNEEDIFGRFGGDEFVILAKDKSLEEGLLKAILIEKSIRSLQMKNNGETLSIQVSMGVADNASGTITTFEELFHLADVALYEAKNRGKNQIYTMNR